jgi:thymidylate kinase
MTSIVIEGLDGVGKSTIVKLLAKKLNGIDIQTPPKNMRNFRNYFDEKGGDERLGYYMVGNFLAGEEMRKFCDDNNDNAKDKFIICDRYYASTRSYILGKNLDLDSTSSNDSLFEFPKELYKPNFMFLLVLKDENVRIERIKKRKLNENVDETKEEEILRKNSKISENINNCFKKFGCIEISADGNEEEIVERIINKLKC